MTAITIANDAKRRFDENHFSPLMTHSSPSLFGAAHEHAGVGAALRLGHREARHDLAVEQRLQVPVLLLLRAVVGEDLGVAGVGGLAAEHRRRPRRAAEDLVHQRELHLAVAEAAEVGAEVTGPQVLLLHLLLQRPDHLRVHGMGLVVDGVRAEREVERLDLGRARTRRSSRAFPGTRARSRSPTSWLLPFCRLPASLPSRRRRSGRSVAGSRRVDGPFGHGAPPLFEDHFAERTAPDRAL